MERGYLTRFAWLSIVTAITTIALKAAAYFLTGSVGLLSDLLESFVNLAAALMALAMLSIAARPPDELHAYGHSKAEYFSSGVEGSLILLAAVCIAWTAIPRLLAPQPLEQVGVGLAVSVLASALNFGVARLLLNAGYRYRSITLEADAQHLMTDVWTSVGVILAVAAVGVSGWLVLDPLIALVVAANIVWTGFKLLLRSVRGLMDVTLPVMEQEIIKKVLNQYEGQGIKFHALRTRQAGLRTFISLHVLVPGEWTVQRGHDLLVRLEGDLEAEVPGAHVFTHLEPVNDPIAWQDITLDKPADRGRD
jgi:cation diffusion facilitator family transporter